MARHLARNKRSNKVNARDERNNSEYQKNNTRRTRRGDNVVDFDEAKSSRSIKRVTLTPRNVAQEDYIDALTDDHKPIIFALGPAGCGKTLLATQRAIQALQNGEIKKVVLTRPAVSVDEQHGFLPGTLIEKMAPWVIPIMDVFKEHYTPQQIEKMLNDEIIEIAPLAYMRGRTMKDCIVLADEMQNSNPNQMKMLLTRIGDNCRMFITGDLAQHDRGYDKNGLKDFTARLVAARSKSIEVIHFEAGDVERHPVIEEILAIYGDEDLD